MADFCHEFDTGGLGCPHPGPCSDECLGDFGEAAQEAAGMLSAGYEIQLGICEGHGLLVYAIMDDDGVVWCEHRGETEDDKQAAEPLKRVKVTP